MQMIHLRNINHVCSRCLILHINSIFLGRYFLPLKNILIPQISVEIFHLVKKKVVYLRNYLLATILVLSGMVSINIKVWISSIFEVIEDILENSSWDIRSSKFTKTWNSLNWRKKHFWNFTVENFETKTLQVAEGYTFLCEMFCSNFHSLHNLKKLYKNLAE